MTAEAVFGHLVANAEMAKKILALAIPKIPTSPEWPEHRALDTAIVTDKKLWPETTVEKLAPILARFLASKTATG